MSIELRGISKSYEQTEVLRQIDLDLPSQGVTALVGPSGSGKTTLLNIIAGLVEADGGRIEIGGVDIGGLDVAERRIGYVFQSFALFPHLDVLDNVAFGLRVRGVARKERHARAMEALSLVQMQSFAKRPIDKLSGGQRQRVALARALVIEPRVLLLDEPLSALDPILRDAIRLELRALLERLDITTLLVTHDQMDAFVLADRIVMLRDGAVVQTGSPRDLYLAPNDVGVARFFGLVNLLDGQQGAVLRPEDLRLPEEGARADLVIEVTRQVFLGDRVRVFGMSKTGQDIVVDLPKHSAYAPGNRLGLVVDPQRAAFADVPLTEKSA